MKKMTRLLFPIAAFAAVLMLANGLEKTMVETGSDDNAIVLRKAAQAELMSQIDRDAVNRWI